MLEAFLHARCGCRGRRNASSRPAWAAWRDLVYSTNLKCLVDEGLQWAPAHTPEDKMAAGGLAPPFTCQPEPASHGGQDSPQRSPGATLPTSLGQPQRSACRAGEATCMMDTAATSWFSALVLTGRDLLYFVLLGQNASRVREKHQTGIQRDLLTYGAYRFQQNVIQPSGSSLEGVTPAHSDFKRMGPGTSRRRGGEGSGSHTADESKSPSWRLEKH